MNEELESNGLLPRRTVAKAAVGAAAAAVVWTEPTIRGLARRPAYASSSSVATTASFPAQNIHRPGGFSNPETVATVADSAGNDVNLVYSEVGGVPQLVATSVVAGCTCELMNNGSSLVNGAGATAANGALVGGIITFPWGGTEVRRVRWFDTLTVTCT